MTTHPLATQGFEVYEQVRSGRRRYRLRLRGETVSDHETRKAAWQQAENLLGVYSVAEILRRLYLEIEL